MPNYLGVRAEHVYPGIDLHYYGNESHLEYDFILEPQADPGLIKLSVDGARKIQIDNQGNLILTTAAGALTQARPFIYQEIDGRRKEISGRYAIKEQNQITFEVGPYDKSKQLIIDPELFYSTYLGGSAGDVADGIGVDRDGNAYVTGTATSVNFPTTAGAYDTNRADLFYEDVFVTKLNPTGTALVYSTFIGGIYGDDAYGMAVDLSGNAYVTGPTGSPDYPTTPNAFQRTHAGVNPANEDTQNDDVFVTKLSNQGMLVYSTYLGGSDDDLGYSIAADSNGNAYVGGTTRSNNFRTTPNALQPVAPDAESDFLAVWHQQLCGAVLEWKQLDDRSRP